jgi:uncharacterized protein YndB with AHSA1/START domain
MASSSTSRIITASPDAVFSAFTDPALLVRWQAPDTMTARMHRHDIRQGGSYEMSLLYDDPQITGKSGGNEDRFTATILELDPPRRIVESIVFASHNPDVSLPMQMTVELEPVFDVRRSPGRSLPGRQRRRLTTIPRQTGPASRSDLGHSHCAINASTGMRGLRSGSLAALPTGSSA